MASGIRHPSSHPSLIQLVWGWLTRTLDGRMPLTNAALGIRRPTMPGRESSHPKKNALVFYRFLKNVIVSSPPLRNMWKNIFSKVLKSFEFHIMKLVFAKQKPLFIEKFSKWGFSLPREKHLIHKKEKWHHSCIKWSHGRIWCKRNSNIEPVLHSESVCMRRESFVITISNTSKKTWHVSLHRGHKTYTLNPGSKPYTQNSIKNNNFRDIPKQITEKTMHFHQKPSRHCFRSTVLKLEMYVCLAVTLKFHGFVKASPLGCMDVTEERIARICCTTDLRWFHTNLKGTYSIWEKHENFA